MMGTKYYLKNGSISVEPINEENIDFLCIASVVSYCIWFGIVKNGELSKLFIIKFAEPVLDCVVDVVRAYSAEVEYSQKNLDKLFSVAYKYVTI